MPDIAYDPQKVLELAEAKGWIIHAGEAGHGNYIITQAGLMQLWGLILLHEKMTPESKP